MYTNETENYQLPQWTQTDKPTFLGDMNTAFVKIDNELHRAITLAESVTELAETANNKSQSAVDKIAILEETVATNGEDIETLKSSLNELETDNEETKNNLDVLNGVTIPLSVTLSANGWVESSVDSRYPYSQTVNVTKKFDKPYSILNTNGLISNELLIFNSTIEQFVYDSENDTITFYTTTNNIENMVEITLTIRG